MGASPEVDDIEVSDGEASEGPSQTQSEDDMDGGSEGDKETLCKIYAKFCTVEKNVSLDNVNMSVDATFVKRQLNYLKITFLTSINI